MSYRLTGRTWARLYAGLGVAVFLLSLLHLGVQHGRMPIFHQLLFGSLMTAISLGLIGGAVWHSRNPFPGERYHRINAWSLGGAVVVSALGIASLYVGSQVVTRVELLESIQVMGSLGLALGFGFGTMEARVVETADMAARAETLETERERLEILNDLLRHYVLNGISVIVGHADQLEANTNGQNRESASIIARRADRIAHLVERISVLTKTEWRHEAVVEADIESVLVDTVEAHCRPETTISVAEDVPSMKATVGFEDGLRLLVDGITSMLVSAGTVHIGVEPDTEAISVTVQPVEIPANLREELLQPVAADIGLELYLAKKILEPAIDLRVTEPSDRELRFLLQGSFVE